MPVSWAGFQVVDDILDVYGDTQALGKQTGRDAELQKVTYLSLLGLESARAVADALHNKAVARLDALPLKNRFLYDLTELLRTRTH